MKEDYRFFQEFFDGQIVSGETKNYKLFKILLFSVFAVAGLVLTLCGVTNIAGLIILVLGMVWNIFLGLENKVSYVFSIVVSLLYFYFAVTYNIFANAFAYVAFYLPLQLIAISRDYSSGSFVQIKKTINDFSRLIFFVCFILGFAILALFSLNAGGRFIILDAVSAILLICSAVLRNERYVEYYWFRIIALVLAIALWIMVLVEYSSTIGIAIVLMYLAYLIFDIVNYVVQHKTYINEYMIQVEKYQKIEDQQLIQEKLQVYQKSKN